MPAASKRFSCATVCLLACVLSSAAGPASVSESGGRVVVTGDRYRLTFDPERLGFAPEFRADDGAWRALAAKGGHCTFALYADGEHRLDGLRSTWAIAETAEAVTIGQQAVADPLSGLVADVHVICTASGALIGTRLIPGAGGVADGILWSPPRLRLDPAPDRGYLFIDSAGVLHSGALDGLAPVPAYAGISPWEQTGDVASGFDSRRPGLVLRQAVPGTDLAVVPVLREGGLAGASLFIQRHRADAVYVYAGYVPTSNAIGRAAWSGLYAFPHGPEGLVGERLGEFAVEGSRLSRLPSVSRPVPAAWARPVPDFPAELRRAAPVEDISEAVVYTVNETTASDYAVGLARKTGSEVWIRGWFKWNQRPPVEAWSEYPGLAHASGALFGGGITCSALYDGENGITAEQLADMATRAPDGTYADAWDTPGVRHGSMSSPAYLDYLFRWCREQIDAGVDYLFMDEHTAALSGLEGYDDHSLADFRSYLLEHCSRTSPHAREAAFWGETFGIDPGDRALCPDGTMATFDYRAYLKRGGFLDNPAAAANPLASVWGDFRAWRDDGAWKGLTDQIRAYAASRGRRVLISANGIAPYVDLQVLGVWGNWDYRDGRIDFSRDLVPVWRSLVRRARRVSGGSVPVVLFHDWGFGDPPFPWLAATATERETWMRVRGAEIYASGAFFAFPVLGPFGCDAGKDGTLAEIRRQTAFYRRHRDVYLGSVPLGSETLTANVDGLGLVVSRCTGPGVLAVHIINRNTLDGVPDPRENVRVTLPLADLPERVELISPDGYAPGAAICRRSGDGIEILVPRVEAYGVAVLHFGSVPDSERLQDPVRSYPDARWSRPARNEFPVLPGGVIDGEEELNGFLQGMLHTHLRNPPTFRVRAEGAAALLVTVQAVSTAGARIVCRIDGVETASVDLPDLDGLNDGNAAEYNRVLEFPIPGGVHTVELDNIGGDWATLRVLEFRGRYGMPPP